MSKFAVFDIDGTLIRWQLYHAVVDELAQAGHISKTAYEAVRKARMEWKIRAHADSFKQYEGLVVRAYEDALPNLEPSVVDECAKRVIQKYKDQVYTYTRNIITTLKHDGYFLLAISGSHQELLDHLAPEYGFDDWIGNLYHRSEKIFTGEKTIVNFDKAITLNKLVDKHHLTFKDSYGFGDSKSDAAFLDLVDNPVAFNPDKELLKLAVKHHWQVVIERKNVTYTIDEIGTTSPTIQTNLVQPDD